MIQATALMVKIWTWFLKVKEWKNQICHWNKQLWWRASTGGDSIQWKQPVPSLPASDVFPTFPLLPHSTNFLHWQVLRSAVYNGCGVFTTVVEYNRLGCYLQYLIFRSQPSVKHSPAHFNFHFWIFEKLNFYHFGTILFPIQLQKTSTNVFLRNTFYLGLGPWVIHFLWCHVLKTFWGTVKMKSFEGTGLERNWRCDCCTFFHIFNCPSSKEL